MKKQFILYILFVASLLQACSTYYDEPDTETPGEREILSLTVTASDIVESNDPYTRSEEMGKSTIFKEDKDTVGLIVLDKVGNLLVDNVPYKYDGSNWNFVGGVDKQPYFDAAMSTYIVYYPYNKEVDGCKNVDDIKSKDVFKPMTIQTSEDDYRQADILVWTSEGKAIRHIIAPMQHIYDSFTFLINIKWTLDPIKEEIAYQPMQETLKNFKIVFIPSDQEKNSTILFDNDDATKNIMYRDKDGCYRYLLTSGEKGTIAWQYTYRNVTFRGVRDIDAGTSGRRYVNHETADMGKLPGPNMQI